MLALEKLQYKIIKTNLIIAKIFLQLELIFSLLIQLKHPTGTGLRMRLSSRDNAHL